MAPLGSVMWPSLSRATCYLDTSHKTVRTASLKKNGLENESDLKQIYLQSESSQSDLNFKLSSFYLRCAEQFSNKGKSVCVLNTLSIMFQTKKMFPGKRDFFTATNPEQWPSVIFHRRPFPPFFPSSVFHSSISRIT